MDSQAIRSISKPRFEALSYARSPIAQKTSQEIEWFSSQNNAILGVILLDKSDKDYAYILLGRDEVGVFIYIDGNHSIVSCEVARDSLIITMESFYDEGIIEFPQGVESRKKNFIFESIVNENMMPSDYKQLIGSELFSPARELIQEIAYSFEDPDGNYIQQFQSTGFNARLWELYLYALFHELHFAINREFNAPDYIIEKSGTRVCVEAVTVNPSNNDFDEPSPKDSSEIENLLYDYMPIKYGSPLYSKLQKKYWEKDHVSGHPLLIAIHDFHQEDSMMWSRAGLECYLYGAIRKYTIDKHLNIKQNITKTTSHKYKEKEIPSNFFIQPNSENISAVIYSNQATIGKFLRMGYLAEFGLKDMDIRFVGQAFINNNHIPVDFDLDVTDDSYEEYWANSVTIYHNPNARIPLDYRLFEGVTHVFFDGNNFSSIKPMFYPIYGHTVYKRK